jgi:Cu-Zn family superoxide dismutase
MVESICRRIEMPKRSVVVFLFASALLQGCTGATTIGRSDALAQGTLINQNGIKAGNVSLTRDGDRVMLHLVGSGFDAGERALHLHQIGTCDGPGFTSAGGHLNPFDRAHGALNEGGKHLGDLPNLQIAEDGNFDVSVSVEGRAEDILPEIFDTDGTAVMIHAGPDDYRTDPSGAAGPRIACAVLKP